MSSGAGNLKYHAFVGVWYFLYDDGRCHLGETWRQRRGRTYRENPALTFRSFTAMEDFLGEAPIVGGVPLCLPDDLVLP